MHTVRSIDLDHLPELRDSLSRWVEWARTELKLEEVHVYGSFARGDLHEGSDIDLILVGPFSGKLPYRIAAVLGTTDLPLQPLCYTPEEWRTLREAQNPLALEVLRTGRRLI
jgi:predicted nucleotidyltransferase